MTQIEQCHESYISGELADEQRSSISNIYNSVSVKIDKDNGNAYADGLEDAMSSYLVEMGARQQAGLPQRARHHGSLMDVVMLNCGGDLGRPVSLAVARRKGKPRGRRFGQGFRESRGRRFEAGPVRATPCLPGSSSF